VETSPHFRECISGRLEGGGGVKERSRDENGDRGKVCGRGAGGVEFERNSTIGEGFCVLVMQRDERKEGIGRNWSERSFFGVGRGMYV
jgi:hypothetical protein